MRGNRIRASLNFAWKRLSKRLGTWPQGYDGYVHQLSERLYRETIGNGGWAVEAGLLGPAHYRADAQRIVQEITLGSADRGVPTP